MKEFYKDRDGDIGEAIDFDADWIRLRYLSGKTSWMPITFLIKILRK